MAGETLTRGESLYNMAVALGTPLHLVDLARFTIAINRRRGKHTRGWQVPKRIEVDAYATGDAPNDIAAMLEDYGISTVVGGGQFTVDGDGEKHWLVNLWVSRAQWWMADAMLRANGVKVTSFVVTDGRRENSAVAAARGPWKPSRRRRRPVTWNQSIRLWLRGILLKR